MNLYLRAIAMTVCHATYKIVPSEESSTPCDCCGRVTRAITGWIDRKDATVAAYWARWTEAHLAANGADFEFAIGAWGGVTTEKDRFAVKLLWRFQEGTTGSVMVVDAGSSRFIGQEFASHGLRRDEVVGTPLASMVFALFDAIWLQDERLFRGDRGEEE